MRQIALIAAASLFAACGGHKAGNAGDTTGAAPGGEAAPAAAPAPGADTTTAGGAVAPSATTDTTASHDTSTSQAKSSAENQTQVGVTNAKSGKSTLDTNVQKVTPTQGEAVTSKGDTLTKKQPPR